MEPYYYSKMNKIQQQVYHEMKAGITGLKPSFIVPRLDGRELQDTFFLLRLDCPEVFYAVSFRSRSYRDSGNIEILPEYLFDKKKVREHQAAMESRVRKLIQPAVSMSDVQKEQYIHDFICTHVRYDKLKKPYSHEIIGPLGQGVGVCEGIAKTVKILCDALGIWCIIAISDANPDKKIKYRHAWNIVKVEGRYYHLDATFDNSLGGEEVIRYDYFNLNDRLIFKDHEPLLCEGVECSDGDRYYYKENKLSFTRMEDVGNRALQAIRKKRPLVFQWRGGYLTKEVLSELLLVLKQTAAQKQMFPKVSLNWSQAILQVIFSGQVPEQELTEEENTVF